MRELLQQALAEVKAARELVYEKTGLVEFNKPLGLESAIEAALSRSKWNKVADGLPVVPDGYGYIFIWLYSKKKTIHRIQYPYPENPSFIVNAHTHWLYCQDDTPQPPRSEV